METGLLGISTFTARRILPVPGVQIYISSQNGDEEVLLYSLVTDENGNTPIVELDAPDMALSEQPGEIMPFSIYNVRAIKEGFFRTIVKDVQVFSGRTSIQNFELIPLPENTEGIDTTNTFIVQPQNL